jgi:hypothetical protein
LELKPKKCRGCLWQGTSSKLRWAQLLQSWRKMLYFLRFQGTLIYLSQYLTFNRTGNVNIASHWSAFPYQFLPWKRNKYYIFWVCVCSFNHPTCKSRATHYIVIRGLSFLYNLCHSKKNSTKYKKCT